MQFLAFILAIALLSIMNYESLGQLPSYFTKYKFTIYMSAYGLATVPIGVIAFMKKEKCFTMAVISL